MGRLVRLVLRLVGMWGGAGAVCAGVIGRLEGGPLADNRLRPNSQPRRLDKCLRGPNDWNLLEAD